MTKSRHAGNLELIGGALCLDLTNTVSTRTGPSYRDYLANYADLVEWSRHVGLLTDHEAQRLGREAARRPDAAAAVLDQALALRETLYRIFGVIAHGQSPTQADVAALNEALAEMSRHLRVLPAGKGFEWQWIQEPEDLDVMLWPVARSAADLLTSADLGRVRQCAGERCDWLFVDTSKNHSRRWCSMNMCGSLDKARRYYQRKRAARKTHVRRRTKR